MSNVKGLFKEACNLPKLEDEKPEKHVSLETIRALSTILNRKN
jgi:hypothetical protein